MQRETDKLFPGAPSGARVLSSSVDMDQLNVSPIQPNGIVRADIDLTHGGRDDAGKDPWDLIPYDAVRGILRILAFGAKKYAPRNWEKGMDWSRVFSSLMRHLTAWWGGEDKDPETGYSHLWHVGCNVLFLIAYEIRGIGRDDRPKS